MDDTLTITDNRTGKQYELPIESETIKALDLRKIKVNDDDFGLMTYDRFYEHGLASATSPEALERNVSDKVWQIDD